jgi:hypothetical protein
LIDLEYDVEWSGDGTKRITLKNMDREYFKNMMSIFEEEAILELPDPNPPSPISDYDSSDSD